MNPYRNAVSDRDTQRKPKRFKAVWAIYQQIAAIIGAFAILAFLGNFADFDWRSWLATLIGMWDELVRPPIQRLLHYVIEVPLSWVGWKVEVRQELRDYFAAMFVFFSSVFRAMVVTNWWSWRKKQQRQHDVAEETDSLGGCGGVVVTFLVIFGWAAFASVVLLVLVLESIDRLRGKGSFTEEARRFVLLISSPLIYAGVLIALNYLVL